MLNDERWLPVVGWEGFYSVSTHGRIRSEPRIVLRAGKAQTVRARFLKPGMHSGGYLGIVLCRDGRPRSAFVHRIVLEAFRGPCPPGNECRHLDGVKTNARLANLEWGTPIENATDRERHGHQVRGAAVGNSKLSIDDVLRIRSDGRTQRVIAGEFGVTQTLISRIKLRKTWAHV